jgi:hypothetical protein
MTGDMKTRNDTSIHGVLQFAGAVLLAGLTSAAVWADTANPRDAVQGQAIAHGGDLCELLGPDDFAAVGVKGATSPVSNSSPPTEFYCVYAGRSSYKGGIELARRIRKNQFSFGRGRHRLGWSRKIARSDLPGRCQWSRARQVAHR